MLDLSYLLKIVSDYYCASKGGRDYHSRLVLRNPKMHQYYGEFAINIFLTLLYFE